MIDSNEFMLSIQPLGIHILSQLNTTHSREKTTQFKMKILRSSRKQSTASKNVYRQKKKSEPTLPLSNDTLKRAPNSLIAKMNMDLSAEEMDILLNPPDSAYDEGYMPILFDPPTPPYDGSIVSGPSSPAGSFDSLEYEDSFGREVAYLNCNDPSSQTVMNINYDSSSFLLSPNSMIGSAVDENDINIDNLETSSRTDSLLLVPDLSQSIVGNTDADFYFPSQDVEKDIDDLLDDNAQLAVLADGVDLDVNSMTDSQGLDVDAVEDFLNELTSQERADNIVVRNYDTSMYNLIEATASQRDGGIEVTLLPSQENPGSPDSATISAGPSYIATSPEVSANESNDSDEPKRRGRKRKAANQEPDFKSASQRKREQNANAAKKYRLKKELEQKKIQAEREKVERELEATRRRVQKKMDERNIMLKLIYDSYQKPESTLKDKYRHIVFPKWLPKFLKTESEESDAWSQYSSIPQQFH